ncbi:MAG: lactonase family protein [Janthinobacterium lividum]
MKNIVRSAVIGGASLAMTLGLTSCSRDYTVGYVYSVSKSNGTVSAYAIDYETGILNQIAGSPFTTPFTNPTTLVAAPNNQFVYVIGGSQNAQVEEFQVGTDGKLYGQHTYSLTGTYPTSAAIDTTGNFLYVTFQYQIGYSPASGGSGGVSIFKINADNSLGTPTTLNVGVNPVSIAVGTPACVATPLIAKPASTSCTSATGNATDGNNVYAYIVDQGTTGNAATVLGFAQNMSTGALTPLSGTNMTTLQGASAGVTPTGIAVDGTTRFVYVTDSAQNEVIGYSIDRGFTGNLTALTGSPFGTGQLPVSLTIDPRSEFLYTANFNSGSISSFAISQSSGNLSAVAGSSFIGGAGLSCVTIEPALGQFLYTSDTTVNLISGGELNTHTGVVSAVQDTPFPTAPLPSCLTSVAAGEHAINLITP